MAWADKLNNWSEYSFVLKKVRGYEVVQTYKTIKVGENGTVKISVPEDTIEDERIYDYYVDVYWKEKRIATDIRLREPHDDAWYRSSPEYTLASGHQNPNFRADKSKFSAMVVLPSTQGRTARRGSENTVVRQQIAQGNPAGTLIERAKASNRFSNIPSDFWILGERSTTNRPNQFDDVIHLMLGEKLMKSVQGTTHSGVPGLTAPYNVLGTAVLDWGWHYRIWIKGGHGYSRKQKKYKLPNAFRQNGRVRLIRDNNKDLIPGNAGSIGLDDGASGINFHSASYVQHGEQNEYKIGTWSVGCIVIRTYDEYRDIWDTITKTGQNILTCCIISGEVNAVEKI